jgi:16S rRNA C1402 (ribose-2'-O) methylase RsmI
MNKEYQSIIEEIIQEQTNIVGQKITQNRIDATKAFNYKNNQLQILIEPKEALKKLIDSFAEIFGDASTEVCEEVIKRHQSIFTKSKKMR